MKNGSVWMPKAILLGPVVAEKAEGKPRCLPKKKAQGMSKEARAKNSTKEKEEKDPNPNRKGKPINVLQVEKGGPVSLIAKGCGKVMKDRRKVTTIR